MMSSSALRDVVLDRLQAQASSWLRLSASFATRREGELLDTAARSTMLGWLNGLKLRLLGGKDKPKEYTIENSGLTRGQIDVGRKALHVLGVRDPVQLSKHQVVIFLYAVGLNPTDDVLDSKFRMLKLHNQETLDFPQVCHVWHSMLQDLADEDEILRRAFQFFDKDGSGDISVAELISTMHELGDLLTEQEILDFMAAMDVNNDGVIGYQEFLDVLRTQSVGLPVEEHTFFDNQVPGGQQVPVAEAVEAQAWSTGEALTVGSAQSACTDTGHIPPEEQQGTWGLDKQHEQQGSQVCPLACTTQQSYALCTQPAGAHRQFSLQVQQQPGPELRVTRQCGRGEVD